MSSFTILQNLLLEEIHRYESKNQDFVSLSLKRDILRDLMAELVTKDYMVDSDQRTLVELQLEILFPKKKTAIFQILDREAMKQKEREKPPVLISNDREWKYYTRFQFFQDNLDARRQYQEHQEIVVSKEYSDLLKQLKKIYLGLVQRMQLLEKAQEDQLYYQELKKLVERLDQKEYLSKKDIEMILQNSAFQSMDPRKMSVLLEAIIINNQERLRSEEMSSPPTEPYLFSKLASFESFEFALPELSEETKTRLDPMISAYCQFLIEEETKESKNYEEVFSPFVNLKEKEYVVAGILNEMKKNLSSLQEFLDVPSLILDDELRREIKRKSAYYMEEYTAISQYYETMIRERDFVEGMVEDTLKTDPKCFLSDPMAKKQFFFVSPSSSEGDGRCCFLEDLKKFPEEYLSKIQNLLISYQNGTISPVKDKYLTDKGGLRELKDDQVRIIYRITSTNNVWILGAIVKKEDNDRKAYDTIARREQWIPNIEDSMILEDQMSKAMEMRQLVEEYLETNKRRGTR